MLTVTFLSRYKDENDYSVRDSETMTSTRVRQYDDGRWCLGGAQSEQPSPAQREAVEKFIAEREAADTAWVADFRARHGQCGFCYQSEQGTHGEIIREWSEDFTQYIPVCRLHTLEPIKGISPNFCEDNCLICGGFKCEAHSKSGRSFLDSMQVGATGDFG